MVRTAVAHRRRQPGDPGLGFRSRRKSSPGRPSRTLSEPVNVASNGWQVGRRKRFPAGGQRAPERNRPWPIHASARAPRPPEADQPPALRRGQRSEGNLNPPRRAEHASRHHHVVEVTTARRARSPCRRTAPRHPGASSGTTNSPAPSVLASTKAICDSEKLSDDFSPESEPVPGVLSPAARAEMSDPVPARSAPARRLCRRLTRGPLFLHRSEPRRHNIFPAVRPGDHQRAGVSARPSLTDHPEAARRRPWPPASAGTCTRAARESASSFSLSRGSRPGPAPLTGPDRGHAGHSDELVVFGECESTNLLSLRPATFPRSRRQGRVAGPPPRPSTRSPRRASLASDAPEPP